MGKIFLFFITVLSFSLVLKAQEIGTFTDTRDGKVYKTVKIGNQTWMAENLAYKCNSGCWEHHSPWRGYLYTFDAAKIACPPGWHVASIADWNSLIAATGGNDYAGKNLKSTVQGWNHTWKNLDAYKFNAYGCGARDPATGNINNVDARGLWWTSAEADNSNAWYFMIISDDSAIKSMSNLKSGGLSVRCVKN